VTDEYNPALHCSFCSSGWPWGFSLLWSVDKLVAPEGTVAILQFFYQFGITTKTAYVVGTLELLLSLAIIAGFLKTYSYGLALLFHAITTLATYQ